MKKSNLHAFKLHRFFLVLWIVVNSATAAVPEVALETDPLIALSCGTHPAGTLTLSGATTSTTTLSASGGYLYQSGFNAVTRSGSLKKIPLRFDGSSGAVSKAATDWDAADILTGIAPIAAKPGANARRIYTSTIAADRSLITIPFFWDNLSAPQKALLNTSPINGADDQLGEKRLEYLRGGRRYEMGKTEGIFRARDRLLGSIVRSVPVFVGAPSTGLQGSDYQIFHAANKMRRPAVYTGSNDGMLHAFDADNGEELFAYIPHALFDRLGYLTLPGNVHRAYVDGPMAIAEARAGNQWKTVLVSGMGGGAQGLFALDVTDPERFDRESGALWEFTDADDADIGHVIGAPAIAKFKVNVVKGAPTYRYFAVVAGGLNNYRDDGEDRFNVDASNVLFLLSLDKAKSEKWVAGVNYFKFVMPIGDTRFANGLAAPALALGADGAVRFVYAGDLQGNLWRFDFTGNAPWLNALGSTPIKPLFTAMDASKNRQPITQKVAVAFAQDGGYLVLFGTGKFLEGIDIESVHFKKQSFYGVLDTLNDKTVGRNQLTERRLKVAVSAGNALEIAGSNPEHGMPGTGKGWYFDFIDSEKTGERSISSAQIVDGKLFFNTFLPSVDPCKSPGGRSYVLNALTGLTINANVTGYPAGAGMLDTPVIMTTAPGEISERDATGKRRVKRKIESLDPVAGATAGTGTPAKKTAIESVTTAGRLSWREIINWIDLRTSSTKK